MAEIESEIEFREKLVSLLEEAILRRLTEGDVIQRYKYSIASGDREFEKMPLEKLIKERDKQKAELHRLICIRDNVVETLDYIEFE